CADPSHAMLFYKLRIGIDSTVCSRSLHHLLVQNCPSRERMMERQIMTRPELAREPGHRGEEMTVRRRIQTLSGKLPKDGAVSIKVHKNPANHLSRPSPPLLPQCILDKIGDTALRGNRFTHARLIVPPLPNVIVIS